jgi:hypothetical protein
MAHDPFEFVEDAPLFIVPRVLDRLRAWRAAPKFDELAGAPAAPGRARLAAELEALAGRLLAGVERHPTKFWVLKQFQQTLDALDGECAETRVQVRGELERLMDILGIGSSDGVLGCQHR